MLAYDTMVLDGRNYLRCTEADESSSISSVSSSASETTSSACRASSHADTMTEEHEACDPHFAALRALFRHLLERQLSTGKVSAKVRTEFCAAVEVEIETSFIWLVLPTCFQWRTVKSFEGIEAMKLNHRL